MNGSAQTANKQSFMLIGAVLGGLLLGLPLASSVAATPAAQRTNSTRIAQVQTGVQAQTGTQTGDSIPFDPQAPLTNPQAPVNSPAAQPTLPEILPENSGIKVAPEAGIVNVTLLNNTDGTVAFRLTSDTANERSTMGMIEGTGVTLRGLEAPFNMTFVRRDGSFLQVTPRIVSGDELEVTLSDPASGDLLTGDQFNIQQNELLQ